MFFAYPPGVDFKVKSLTVAGKRLKLSIWVSTCDMFSISRDIIRYLIHLWAEISIPFHEVVKYSTPEGLQIPYSVKL